MLNRVQKCKFGGHAQHTGAPYAFVDGTGAFPRSGLLFNCVTGEGKGRRAASDHSAWRSNHDGHPDFVVNFSSRACGACRRALRVHALELALRAHALELAGLLRLPSVSKFLLKTTTFSAMRK